MIGSFLLALALGAAPAAAEPTWNQLRSTEATATSFLQNNWNKYQENYHPNYALDDNPLTAWVEGASGNGEGESITIPVSALASARAVKVAIRNGYQKSDKLLSANAAPKDVRITVLGPGGAEVAHSDATLQRKMGWQELVIPVPVGRGLSAVKLEIRSVHAGTTYKDTCVSDIDLYVDSDVPYRAGLESARFNQLKAWIKERTETAAWFATQPADLPFSSTNFQYAQIEPFDIASFSAAADPLKAALAALIASPTWYSAASPKQPRALPDGTWPLEELRAQLNLKDAGLFEATSPKGRHTRDGDQEGEGWSSERWESNYKVSFAADGKTPAQVVFSRREVVSERGTYESNLDWLLSYDEAGRLKSAYAQGTTSDEMGPAALRRLITFERDANGRIRAFDVWTTSEYKEPWEGMEPVSRDHVRYTGT